MVSLNKGDPFIWSWYITGISEIVIIWNTVCRAFSAGDIKSTCFAIVIISPFRACNLFRISCLSI